MSEALINDYWYSPRNVMECVSVFFGKDGYFDPCPIDPTFDGLALNPDGLEYWWPENCYLNPPFSGKLKRAFINMAIKQYNGGRYLWMFNYANSQDLWNVHKRASAVLIPEVRFKFIPGHPLLTGHPDNPDPEKRKQGSPQYDNIMILWGNTMGFDDAFGHLGKVYITP